MSVILTLMLTPANRWNSCEIASGLNGGRRGVMREGMMFMLVFMEWQLMHRMGNELGYWISIQDLLPIYEIQLS